MKTYDAIPLQINSPEKAPLLFHAMIEADVFEPRECGGWVGRARVSPDQYLDILDFKVTRTDPVRLVFGDYVIHIACQ